MRVYCVFLFLLTLAVPAAAQTKTFDSTAIDRAIAAFTGKPVGEKGGAARPVDPRLKLAPCPVNPVLEWYGSAAQSVLVRCPTGPAWRIFVPIIHDSAAPSEADRETLISRGDAVAIIIQGSGFTLSRQGEALESGGAGDWIRIRPHSSKKYQRADAIRARILAPGKVAIAAP